MLVECFIPKKQVFSLKIRFHIKKAVKHHNFTPPAVWCKLSFLQNFAVNLLLILYFFSFLACKTLKTKILTSVWSAQHPNAGGNIQHLLIILFFELNICQIKSSKPTLYLTNVWLFTNTLNIDKRFECIFERNTTLTLKNLDIVFPSQTHLKSLRTGIFNLKFYNKKFVQNMNLIHIKTACV